MKIYKLNSLTTFFLATLVVGLLVFLPVLVIELLWNNTIGKTYTDITINFWQALILWLIVLVTLNILGAFKFEFAIETHDSVDKEILKNKIQDLKSNNSESIQAEQKANNDSEGSKNKPGG